MQKSKFYNVSICETSLSRSKGSFGGLDLMLTEREYSAFPLHEFIEHGLSVSVFIVESNNDGVIQNLE